MSLYFIKISVLNSQSISILISFSQFFSSQNSQIQSIQYFQFLATSNFSALIDKESHALTLWLITKTLSLIVKVTWVTYWASLNAINTEGLASWVQLE